jgi:hypothetical protein
VAVYSLLHFLAVYTEWVLPTTLLFGARTFLVNDKRYRDRLADPSSIRVIEMAGEGKPPIGDGFD